MDLKWIGVISLVPLSFAAGLRPQPVYVNRTWVDALRGFWRPFINHRVRSQARRVFAAARTRIEANDGN